MSLREHVYSVLIVSSSENFSASLTDFMPVGNFSPVSTATSVSEAKRRLQDRKFDFVIINSPLPDDFGSRLATDISTSSQSVVLLLVRNEIYEGVYEKVTDSGVITLSKPVSKAVMTEVLRIMGAVRERLRALERKTSTLDEKMEEIRTVNRAKWLLIEHLKMTENDAQISDIKDAMLVAVLTDNTDLQIELKQEYAAVVADTNKKLSEVSVND